MANMVTTPHQACRTASNGAQTKCLRGTTSLSTRSIRSHLGAQYTSWRIHCDKISHTANGMNDPVSAFTWDSLRFIVRVSPWCLACKGHTSVHSTTSSLTPAFTPSSSNRRCQQVGNTPQDSRRQSWMSQSETS